MPAGRDQAGRIQPIIEPKTAGLHQANVGHIRGRGEPSPGRPAKSPANDLRNGSPSPWESAEKETGSRNQHCSGPIIALN